MFINEIGKVISVICYAYLQINEKRLTNTLSTYHLMAGLLPRMENNKERPSNTYLVNSLFRRLKTYTKYSSNYAN